MTLHPLDRVLGLLAAGAALVALVLALAVAPPDAYQGDAQRLMYVHVPAAWTAYLSFAVVAVASLAYVVKRDLRYDRVAQAAAELGVGLTALAIVLGSLWAYPTWGTWWTWDPRLVTTAILLLVYIGYLGVRGLSTDPDVNARRAAVVGVLAVVNVPLVHFSVVWWRTLHQPPSVLRPGGPDGAIPPVMLSTLLVAIVAFTLLWAWVLVRRTRLLTSLAADRSVEVAVDEEAAADHPEIVVVTTDPERSRP
ncbi:Heme exporter protein C [Nocardioides dokdonensis FR1436]|uniref:Heme exporter protein C n=1 Tax=Nocardioides dokdonensis FR1436 TaxID=1300347 RepID=A0A1A9GNN0_9ACTN|nr:cytochrome c biogenesis protein CcsA [Nocardioides dokdonensis]ANH39262.1 Heme exporter protein C [Nocardioides dokdonensis FR1436]